MYWRLASIPGAVAFASSILRRASCCTSGSSGPPSSCRIIEPIEGSPRIRVSCKPSFGLVKGVPTETQGSHHIRYHGYASQLRLTTDVPLSYLNEQAFALTERRHLVLSWGDPWRTIGPTVRALSEQHRAVLADLGEALRLPILRFGRG